MNRTLEKYQTRDWTEGDIYAPHDLSAAEMRKFKKRQSPPTDAFDALNLNPLDLYKVHPETLVCLRTMLTVAELLDHV